MWCTNPYGWVLVRCAHGSEGVVPARCRRCDGCRAFHRTNVFRRISVGLEAAESAALLTLTSLPGTTVPDMMKAWNRFKAWLKKRVPNLEYAAVKEFGGVSGMLHLHIAVVGWEFVDQRDLSAAWERASGARVVDIRRIKQGGANVAGYVAKYIGKQLGVEGRDLRKQVTYSRGWPKDADPHDAWHFAGETSQALLPPANVTGWALPGGMLLTIDRGCECVASAQRWGLGGELHLWRLSRRIPPT